MPSMIPLWIAILLILTEVFFLWIWIKLIAWSIREKPRAKKKIQETKLRGDNYPFEEGTPAGWFKTFEE